MKGAILASTCEYIIEATTFEAAPVIHAGADSHYHLWGVGRSEDWKYASTPKQRNRVSFHIFPSA
ncbi:hypothetical protein [Brevibacillus porteri]|uniref:Uncharacterized protein n=1 Tax=Brevibacillus porteri TaxID=2126350 RepID=A0ABX5FZZ9_9BACL|nr:hypothetical protein [Brevibacillus porteri]MED1800952.1 hypothetical protein [Brevibacillus porteri]MED2130338.1 hypothetical protein [Brevibacillus porteri]MED2742819.1 hypothetical protein [Brevibacillus porteri]MED2817301.1 hypothetical protein [Brevibacillus porteri]MED2895965.1 hypothetical protein [Brevibacillus porteri]